MHMFVAAAMLSAELAVAAPAPGTPAPVAQQEPVVAADWAAAPPSGNASPDKTMIRRAIKQSFEEEKAIAEAQSKAAAIPQRYSASAQPDQDKYEKFGAQFSEAKVPGCLQSDGLKRQPTFFLGGLLALPFVAVAAIRGKCN